MHALLRVIRKNRVVLYDRISILFVDKILRKQTWKKLGRRSRKSIFLNYDTKCDTIIVTWHVRAVFILTISFFCVTCTLWPCTDLPVHGYLLWGTRHHWGTRIKRCAIFKCIFRPQLPSYAIAHAKVEYMIFSPRVPWNGDNFGIILVVFWSSTNWALRI